MIGAYRLGVVAAARAAAGGDPAPGLPAATFWRAFFVGNNGDSYISLSELEMRNPAGIDITLSASQRTGSSHYNSGGYSYPVVNAFDGDPATPWLANSNNNEWLQLTFSSAVRVGSLILKTSPASNAAKQAPIEVVLEYSDNGAVWQELQRWSGLSDWTPSDVKTLVVEMDD